VWGVNERERVQGASAKEMQSAMKGKYGGRAQRNRGEARKDDDGQDYEGRRGPGGGEGRTVLGRIKRLDHRWVRKRSEGGDVGTKVGG
jgi:hypothetical protein